MNSEMTFIIIIRLTQVQLNMAGTELRGAEMGHNQGKTI